MEAQDFTPTYPQPEPPAVPTTPQPSSGNGLAIGALICGIFAIVLSFTIAFGIILGILAIVLAMLAKSRMADGKATAGMVCGILGIVFAICTTVLVFAGVAVLDSVFEDAAYEDTPVAIGDESEADENGTASDGEVVSDTLEGTYRLSTINVTDDGLHEDDLEVIGHLDPDAVQMSIFDDGTLFLSAFGATTQSTWEETDEGVIRLHDNSVIHFGDDGELNYTIEDGELTLEAEGVSIVFQKTSDTPTTLEELIVDHFEGNVE